MDWSFGIDNRPIGELRKKKGPGIRAQANLNPRAVRGPV